MKSAETEFKKNMNEPVYVTKEQFLQDILDRVASITQCGTSPEENVILDAIELRAHKLKGGYKMTTLEMMKNLGIGKRATVNLGDLQVRVNILEARVVYNNPQYQITPCDGHGTKWVMASSLLILD